MKIECIGGGPAGLYFSILMKQAHPGADITVYERNAPTDTFGWGVVFSDETLGHFRQADAPSFDEITANFTYWPDIETYYGGTCVRSTGHGFCGMSRRRLLEIMQGRARDLGVDLRFETDIDDVAALAASADLLVGADGLNSMVRTQGAEAFRPSIHTGSTHFCWLGTDRHLDAFTFVFAENDDGLFIVHAYPFQDDLSTWIVECDDETWHRAGLAQATEEQTVAYCEALFADHLKGHRLLTNRSIWRQFPTVKNERWHHENVVLLGDAAHTAHFSIGSGTKLAMEDAIALVGAFERHGTGDVPQALAAYQDSRWVDAARLQKVAQTSRTWFEQAQRYQHLHPLAFTFNMLCRSKQITYDNLAVRDPELVRRVTEWWWDEVAQQPRRPDGSAPPPMFAPFKLRELELVNRVAVSPMCQYSAVDGVVNDWHLVHLGARATGGAGLIVSEMTDVSAAGRITLGCAGMYTDAQEVAWKRIVDFVHGNSHARLAMQLAHAGRKASTHLPWDGGEALTGHDAWETLAPSAIPFVKGWPTPRAMTRDDMDQVRDDFVAATQRCLRAGFDMVELHMAHGYLLSTFLSPLSNRRDDDFGGSLENRMRFPLEVFEAVRAAWPAERPLAVRLSATDWLDDDGGQTLDDTLVIARALSERGCDLIDVSSAGNVSQSHPEFGRLYQVPFAEQIKQEVDVAVMAVGAIQGHDHCNTILAAGRTDLCALARPHLINPSLTLGAAVTYGHHEHHWPDQYLPAKPQPKD